MVENTAPEPAPVITEEQDEVIEAAATPLVESDLLVEDVSIDGMCGVY
jgi:mycofactocin precursor